MKTKNIFPAFWVGLSLFVLAGCGSGQVPLSGKVTFSDDGSPLGVGTICFEKDAFCARGRLQPDGTFTVGLHGKTDGLPPGTYQVYIAGANREVTPEVFEPLIDERLQDVSTSDLTVEVTSSTKKFDITVDRYKKKK